MSFISRIMYVLPHTDDMTEIAITDARGRLASIIDTAKRGPVYLTRRNRPVAAIIDTDLLNKLIEDSEELADIRAVDAAWEETARLSETPIPWEEVKRDLGLS
jgi:prevent-host-death family protein